MNTVKSKIKIKALRECFTPRECHLIAEAIQKAESEVSEPDRVRLVINRMVFKEASTEEQHEADQSVG